MNNSKAIAHLLNLPKITDFRGNLTFVENNNQIPFEILEASWIYDFTKIESDTTFNLCLQNAIIIALSGSFCALVHYEDKHDEIYNLNRSYNALHLINKNKVTLKGFSTNSLALLISSSSIIKENESIGKNRFNNFKPILETKKLNFSSSEVKDCKISNLGFHKFKYEKFTTINNNINIPYEIKRIYYLYNVPFDAHRGGHAHRNLRQFIIAAMGSFDVILDDGKNKKTVTLNNPSKGLEIKPGIWRELNNFSSGSICLVLASEKYSEDDYFRDYSDFIKNKNLR